MDEQKVIKIRELNDALREEGKGGQIIMVATLAERIRSMSPIGAALLQMELTQRLINYDAFEEGDNPYGERDFGHFVMSDGQKIFWKIDYYDLAEENGSPDPSDPSCTVRIMSVFHAEDY